MTHFLLSALIVLTVFTAPAFATPTPCFYALTPSENAAQLIKIDPTDASIDATVNLLLNGVTPAGIKAYSLAFSPDNTLYGWDTAKGQLFTIANTTEPTAAINYVGNATGLKVTGLAFDQFGSLYGLQGNGTAFDFVSINPATSAVSRIGDLGATIQSNGLAVDFATGEIYGVSGNGYDKVFKIDKATGQATVKGSLGTTVHGVGTEFLPGTRDLYSVRGLEELWKFNLDSHTSSYVGNLGGSVPYDAVSLAAMWPNPPAPVPEPATMLLMGTGIAGLAGSRMRRRKK